jgi:hypothetical protein
MSVAPMADERNPHAGSSCIFVFIIEALFHLY